MEVIRHSDLKVIDILGEPIVKSGIIKRFINNCLCYDVDDGIVILNSLTKAIVFLKNDELDNLHELNTYAFLYKNYFFVDEDFDEWEAFEKVRQTLRKPLDDLYLDHPSGYTILTTTKCNARCSYCYENLLKHRQHMTEETAIKIADYIYKFSPIDVPANIGWFGGEPLVNIKVIDLICNYLRDHGKLFNSSITTNGYLFNEQLVKKAKYSWNLYDVQITIDGIGKAYDDIKKYIDKDNISPYKKVINNIKLLINEGINVVIRINLDLEKIKNDNNYYKDLIKELHKVFHNTVNIYVHPLFDLNNKLSDEENELMYNYACELEDYLYDYNYITYKSRENLVINHCMADHGTSIIINEEGKFGVCEHYVDSNFFSSVDDPFKKDFSELSIWKKYINNKKLCDGCPILGDCVKIISCEDDSDCLEYKKKWEIHKYLNGLKAIYRDYRNNNKLKIDDSTSAIE